MNFGCAGDPDIKNCAFCGEKVQIADKLMVDREIIHKGCFNCCYCGAKLQAGSAAMEQSFFNRYGPRWYCAGALGNCALVPVAQKDAKLKERGLNVKKTGKAKK
uniref:LIM zinc-binding domain-containing protein n=2 Tax=Meloidogyne TaxID=189290 RepID=A0A6V7XJG2_MELEN|nr:unnamed protein product [Meloidogyne enterolobii]CAD2199027.1 unnamed protein product [Meloidogyne enterolobii]